VTPDPPNCDDTHVIDPDYGNAEITPKMGINYPGTEIMLPKGGSLVKGCISVCKRDRDDNPIELANSNPILDTCSYIVDFDDCNQTDITSNMMAESLYSQCDPDGNQYVLLDKIVDYQCLDSAIIFADQKIVQTNGRTYLKHSTIGWQLCCQWKDGSSSWENLIDLKESHPIETAKHAKIIGIDHEPAFNWWVSHVIKKRDQIILLVKKWNPQYLKRTHKFGIEVPKTIREALELDKKNGNTFWADAIAKEMKDDCVTFKILLDRQSAPIGYHKYPATLSLR
jgi:hypothetical protein